MTQFRLLYSNAGDFAETPVSSKQTQEAVKFYYVILLYFTSKKIFVFLDSLETNFV